MLARAISIKQGERELKTDGARAQTSTTHALKLRMCTHGTQAEQGNEGAEEASCPHPHTAAGVCSHAGTQGGCKGDHSTHSGRGNECKGGDHSTHSGKHDSGSGQLAEDKTGAGAATEGQDPQHSQPQDTQQSGSFVKNGLDLRLQITISSADVEGALLLACVRMCVHCSFV